MSFIWNLVAPLAVKSPRLVGSLAAARKPFLTSGGPRGGCGSSIQRQSDLSLVPFGPLSARGMQLHALKQCSETIQLVGGNEKKASRDDLCKPFVFLDKDSYVCPLWKYAELVLHTNVV
jgi:hypothetical protein